MTTGTKQTAYIATMTNEEYHAKEGLSASGIKLLLECPRKYWWRYVLKNKSEATKALTEGTEFHTFILEREEFDKRYYAIPSDTNTDRRTKEGKANCEAMQLAAGARQLIDTKRIEVLTDMRASLYSLPRLAAVLANGQAEQAIFWQDQESGIWLKTKPDYINSKVKTVVDLKTTEDASYEGFSRSIYKWGYHIQGAMQADGVKALTGESYTSIYLPVEKSAPYCSAAYMINESDLDHGRTDYHKAIAIYKKCIESDYWPSYSEYEENGKRESLKEISIPYWAQQQYLLENV